MELNSKQRKYLKGLAHKLNANVIVGHSGVSEGVLKEINATLEAHELLKIKIRCEGQKEMEQMVKEISSQTDASLVQVLGHTVTLYRPSKEQKILLP